MSRTLTLDEAADVLKTTAETVSECIRLRGLPTAKIGRAWVLVEADAIDWLRQQYIEHGATMKHKTAKLTGALLDAAVALAEGDRLPDYWRDPGDGTPWLRPGREEWHPSERWDQGGPIIERERIQLDNARDSDAPASERRHFWMAAIYSPFWEPVRSDAHGDGPTPLIAAMRAYVAAKLGEEVDP